MSANHNAAQQCSLNVIAGSTRNPCPKHAWMPDPGSSPGQAPIRHPVPVAQVLTQSEDWLVMPDPGSSPGQALIRHPAPVAQVLTQSEDWLVMPDMIRHPVPRTPWIADRVRNDKCLNGYFGNFYLPKQSLTHQQQRSS